MRGSSKTRSIAKASAVALLGVLLFVSCALSTEVLFSSAYADADKIEKAKVGVVEQTGVASRDANGILRGYDAEFLNKVAQYCDFDIEYAYYEDFNQLLGALEAGEVDLAVGISKTADRETRFAFSKRKVGSGEVVLKIRPDDTRYEYGNIEQIASMRIGTTAGSVIVAKAQEWEEQNGINVDLVEYSGEDELVDALYTGKIDGAFINEGPLQECCEILRLSAIDYYVAINKDKAALRLAVDSAMNQVYNEDSLFFERLSAKYKPKSNSPLVLTASEKEYLNSHSETPFSVAVLENDAPFNEMSDGKAKGIVADFYEHLSGVISKSGTKIEFSYVAYPNLEAAIKGVANGETDVLGLTCIDAITANQFGLALTDSFSMLSISRVSLPDEQSSSASSLDASEEIRAAVLSSEQETFSAYLSNRSEKYSFVGYTSLDECYEALQNGSVDAVVTTSPRANWLLNQHRTGTFVETTVSGSNLPACAALSPSNSALKSLISRASSYVSTDLDTIISSSIAPKSDLGTLFNRLPVRFLVIAFVVILLAVGAFAFGINRALRNREISRKDSELIEAQDKLLASYEHDSLTGLVNRDGALRRVNGDFADSENYSMVLVSIDNINVINETYGHAAGDKVMVEIAQRLVEFCLAGEERRVVYRYGLGLFLVVIGDRVDSLDDVRVREIDAIACYHVAYKSEIAAGGKTRRETIRLQASIGVAVPEENDNPEQVILKCGMAVDQARESKNDPVCYFADNLLEELERSNQVQDVVERAIEERMFFMMYQPQIDLATREVSGYEALVRIADANVSPGEFIPVAESKGLIRQIGRITTKLVVKQLADWKDAGIETRPVSINYSSMQIGDVGYADYLLNLLEKYQVDPSLVKIEITERLFTRQEAETEEFFENMQKAGIKILMDDFGTGYSSLNYLAYIPVDVIKLDKSIVDAFLVKEDISDNLARGNDFVRNIVQLAHDLGKTIIAEGVEERWQVELLEVFGCDAIQGYYFSRPLLAEDVALYSPDFT